MYRELSKKTGPPSYGKGTIVQNVADFSESRAQRRDSRPDSPILNPLTRREGELEKPRRSRSGPFAAAKRLAFAAALK